MSTRRTPRPRRSRTTSRCTSRRRRRVTSRRDDVPADIVAKEREVLEELSRNEGKPENALPKIVEGRLNGFYKDVVLLEQPFVRDPKTTVGKLVEGLGSGATVRRFARVKIGED